jgi:hypothetical protein
MRVEDIEDFRKYMYRAVHRLCEMHVVSPLTLRDLFQPYVVDEAVALTSQEDDDDSE